MKDKAISVQKNEKEINKVYLNNIRVEEGILKSTVTCVNAKEQKIQHEVNKVEVNLMDVLAPAALQALGLKAVDEKPVENKKEVKEKLKEKDAKKKKDTKKEKAPEKTDSSNPQGEGQSGSQADSGQGQGNNNS